MDRGEELWTFSRGGRTRTAERGEAGAAFSHRGEEEGERSGLRSQESGLDDSGGEHPRHGPDGSDSLGKSAPLTPAGGKRTCLSWGRAPKTPGVRPRGERQSRFMGRSTLRSVKARFVKTHER